ncbi:hypothetical protein FNF28_05548 [Cafeteria roenbergensis]|uniref:Uncharacterized protein n=1 Tax=Cafeteria roenbergensis TaxID=33653 RepID=A0A5A8D7A1_CAFRO|nr:hypothetical protein FNF28_05548 [Cafeteria roenbergensis]
MARLALAALACAAALSTAVAKLPAVCLDQGNNAASGEFNAGKLSMSDSMACKSIQAAKDTVSYVTVEIDQTALDQAGAAPMLEVAFWNVRGQYSDPAFEKGATNKPVVVGAFYALTNLCAGKYHFVVNSKGWGGGNLDQLVVAGVVWRLRDSNKPEAVPTVSVGSPATISNSWFPAAGRQVQANVAGQRWADLHYMLKAATVSASADALLFNPDAPANAIANIAVVAPGGATWGGASTFNITKEQAGSSTTASIKYDWYDGVFDYAPGSPSQAGPTSITLTANTADNAIRFDGGSQYRMENVGPFVDVTISLDRAEEFPHLTTDSVALHNPSISVKASYKIYMIETTDPLVYEMGATASMATGNNLFTGGDKVVLGSDGVSVSAFLATPGTAQSNSAGTFASANGVIPSHMASFYTAGSKLGNGKATPANLPVQWTGSTKLTRPYIAFVRVAHSTTCGDYPVVSATVTMGSFSAQGECASNYDCAGPSGTHPSQDRAKYSANGDASRFSSCYMTVNTTGFGTSKPYSKCFECAPAGNPNFECNENQFCWTDPGTCTFDSNEYVCDVEASMWMGICRNKSSEVLGSRCRTVATGTVAGASRSNDPTTGTGAVTPSSLGAAFLSDKALNGFAPGAGFCGEVRVFNESNTQLTFNGNDNVQFGVNGTARSILWTGSCVQGICMECTPSPGGGYDGDSGRQCVNGRLVDTVFIDGTARTLTSNTMASATAVGAGVLVVLAFLQLVSMQNDSNRHRELFGEGPMGCLTVLFAMLFQWMCCCKRSSDRTVMAPFKTLSADGGKVGSAAGTTSPSAATPLTAGSVTNPLEGKQAQDWGTRA